MCGFFSWFKRQDRLSPETCAEAALATHTLSHRGPDATGQWHDEQLFLGHQRLKIIDLSAAADQPFHSGSREYVIVFNGAIYNYLELRNTLQRDGVQFKTFSDTEVFIECFARYGTKTFALIEGMYAATIYHKPSRTIYLVRDPLGQKPLYYFLDGQDCIASSEIRALLSLSHKKWTLDKKNFIHYMSLGYYPDTQTPVSQIHKLQPGHYLEITEAQHKLVQFWHSVPGQQTQNIGYTEANVELSRLLSESCKQSLRCDVPIGVFLSGGIDSTLLYHECHKQLPQVQSFNVSMPDKDYDEHDKIDFLKDYYLLQDHHTFKFSYDHYQQLFQSWVDHLDEPHGDPGYINALFLAQKAKQHVKVAIAGDGADELAAGYVVFQGLDWADKCNSLPGAVPHLMRRMCAQFLRGGDSYLGLQFKALAYLQGLTAPQHLRIPLWLSSLSYEELGQLFGKHMPECFSDTQSDQALFHYVKQACQPHDQLSSTDQLLHYYQRFFLPEFICQHTDRAAMQVGLEVRSPFLSTGLIKLCNELPSEYKYHQGQTKRCLKRQLENRGLPKQFTHQKKHGFTFPVARLLKQQLKETLEHSLQPEHWPDGLLDLQYLHHLKDEHFSGKRNHYRILYNAMIFQQWQQHHPHIAI